MDKGEKHGPWRTLSSETVHESNWIRVDYHDVIIPSGAPGAYSTVHFKNLAIGVVPLDKDNNTYLVGQYRYPIKDYSWEIPEGGGPRDIPPIDSAKRELKEETGIIAQEWEILYQSHLSNSASDEYAITYLARDLEFGEAEPEPDEDIQVKKVSLEEFIRMVNDGEITDSLSMMAAMRLEVMLLKGEL